MKTANEDRVQDQGTSLRGRRILIVDDDPGIRGLTRLVLADAGYAVVEAATGAQALRRMLDSPVDLVLLDVNMPVMTGWETLRVLKANEELRQVPVVMFTVKSELRDKVHGLQDGALDYITKPFEVDELLTRLTRIFQSLDQGPRGPLPVERGP